MYEQSIFEVLVQTQESERSCKRVLEASILTLFLLDLDKRQRIPKGHSNMDNPEKLATQGTQDKDKQMLENIEGALKHGHSRETGNIGYTRRGITNQKHNTAQFVGF